MSLLPEIVQKFKDDLALFGECIVERVQELLPDLSPEEQQDAPILMSDTVFATVLFCPTLKYTTDEASYQGDGCVFKSDISLSNNHLSFNVGDYIGMTYDVSWAKDVSLENSTNSTIFFELAHEGDLSAALMWDGFQIKLYYGGAYHPTDIRFKIDAPVTTRKLNLYLSAVRCGNESITSFSVTNEIVSWTPAKDIKPQSSGQIFYALKSYPFISNVKDTNNINNWVSNNGATNNYTTTYTTPNNKTITVYYGDNYIITHVNNDEPVSYNDIKNAVDIAVDQINDDNGTDISHVPDYPIPTPPGLDDDIEVDMPLNDAAFGTGLSHYYVTTVAAPVLDDISEAMSAWDITNTGKDLYRNLLSCRITKVGPIPSESSTFVIYGEELLHNGSPITITKITGNPSMDLGEYEILPKFNDFRDYAPFTKIEMFIPYCGWVSLPSHCMSSEDKPKIITGTLLCDIIAGTCKAVIKCNDTVVAEASGFTAIDVPFTGENVGMKMAGIASSITSYGNQAAKTVGSVASGGLAGGAGAGAALAGGLVGMAGSYAQMYSAFNANYTEICGKTGDGCNVAGLGSVYIKIQRPKAGDTEAPYYVPANYAHTTGFMSMRQKQISECEGLIVCANVDTSGISGATARERAEIKRLLETGIYVNLPEPEPPEP